ncbi:hypothetical protein [Trinickia dinghuensis]|nr:hypothetical protein [Trinickia dinghuensis]
MLERATAGFGGGGGTPQSAARSGAIESSRQSFAEMAGGGSGAAAMLNDAASAPKSYSWLQRYDDVSADDLINYIQSVVGSPQSEAAAPDADPSSSPLGDAQAFEYGDGSPLEKVQDVAARGVSEEDEAECHATYELDMEQCDFAKAMYGGDLRTYSLCTSRAFENYQACRGY